MYVFFLRHSPSPGVRGFKAYMHICIYEYFRYKAFFNNFCCVFCWKLYVFSWVMQNFQLSLARIDWFCLKYERPHLAFKGCIRAKQTFLIIWLKNVFDWSAELKIWKATFIIQRIIKNTNYCLGVSAICKKERGLCDELRHKLQKINLVDYCKISLSLVSKSM